MASLRLDVLRDLLNERFPIRNRMWNSLDLSSFEMVAILLLLPLVTHLKCVFGAYQNGIHPNGGSQQRKTNANPMMCRICVGF